MYSKMFVAVAAPKAFSINPFTPQDVYPTLPSAVKRPYAALHSTRADGPKTWKVAVECPEFEPKLPSSNSSIDGQKQREAFSDSETSRLIAPIHSSTTGTTIDLPVRSTRCGGEICLKVVFYTCAVSALFLIWFYGYYKSGDGNN